MAAVRIYSNMRAPLLQGASATLRRLATPGQRTSDARVMHDGQREICKTPVCG